MPDSLKEKISDRTLIADTSTNALTESERLFHELNLLRLEGYIFDFAKKHGTGRFESNTVSEDFKLPNGIVIKNAKITIDPHPRHGKPQDVAYKIYHAVLKKLSDEGYEYATHVAFTQREIQRMIGRKEIGGKDSKEFLSAVLQLRRTGITCTIYDKTTEEAKMVDFNIFSSAYLSSKSQRIDRCVFEVNENILRSLRSRFGFLINYTRVMDLKDPIAMALYKHLYDSFRRLHSLDQNREIVFRKSYRSVCREWFGGSLKVHKFRSKILDEQFGSHFATLKRSGLVKTIDIEKAMGEGFNLIATPGSSFFSDYELFYAPGRQLRLPFKRAIEDNLVALPLELVAYFHKRRLGVEELDEPIFPDKELELASQLLDKYPMTECRQIVDYALEEARTTNFQVQTFGGIKPYITSYAATKAAREAKAELATARRQAELREERESQYRLFRRRIIALKRETLSREAIDEIEASIRDEEARRSPDGLGVTTFVRLRADELIAELCNIPTFEEWLENSPAS